MWDHHGAGKAASQSWCTGPCRGQAQGQGQRRACRACLCALTTASHCCVPAEAGSAGVCERAAGTSASGCPFQALGCGWHPQLHLPMPLGPGLLRLGTETAAAQGGGSTTLLLEPHDPKQESILCIERDHSWGLMSRGRKLCTTAGPHGVSGLRPRVKTRCSPLVVRAEQPHSTACSWPWSPSAPEPLASAPSTL